MFDFFRAHMRIFQYILVLLIVPAFIFVGVQGYQSSGDGANQSIAKVAGQSITQGEFNFAHREQVDRVRRQRRRPYRLRAFWHHARVIRRLN